MGTLKEYQCNGCCYTVTGTRKGHTLGMMGEIETKKVPRKCPKCGGDMKETGAVIMID
jgi:NAD-dependent SIR2 family protein deacetylase